MQQIKPKDVMHAQSRIAGLLIATTMLSSPALAAELPSAQPGETVVVQPGTYNQRLVIDTDNTTYRCASPGACTITADAGREGIVSITGNNSTLDGFTIDGEGKADIGVWIGQDGGGGGEGSSVINSTVQNINTDGGAVGSAIESAADGAIISDNTVRNVGSSDLDHGIYISKGSGWQVSGNDVSGASGFGIHLWHQPGAGTIEGNVSHDNGICGITVGAGADAGEASTVARGISVSGNTTYGNAECGIQEAGDVADNTYTGNNVADGMNLKSGKSDGGKGAVAKAIPEAPASVDGSPSASSGIPPCP